MLLLRTGVHISGEHVQRALRAPLLEQLQLKPLDTERRQTDARQVTHVIQRRERDGLLGDGRLQEGHVDLPVEGQRSETWWGGGGGNVDLGMCYLLYRHSRRMMY